MKDTHTSLTNTIKYSDSEVLSFLLQAGKIDLGSVEDAMNNAEIERVIRNNHPYPITQGSDGRWRTYVKDPSRNHNRRQIAKSTLEELRLELFCHYTGKEKKEVSKPTTLRSFYPEWIEYKRLHTNAESYIKRIDSVWKNHYENENIVDVPLIRLDTAALDKWAHGLIKNGNLNKRQYYNLTMIMRQSLDYAVELGIIPSNPFSKVTVDSKRMFRKERKKSSETQVFSIDEIEQMEELAWMDFKQKKHPVNTLVPLAMIFQFQTGLRACELCAVRYEDIDEDIIRIRRMYRSGSNDVVDDTKGTFGEREVILTDKAKNLIATAQSFQKENNVDPNGYIFSMTDEPMSYYALKKLYPKYCEQLGIIKKSSHKARKSYISALIDGGVNINTIREMVGHNDERTTLNCYCYDRNSVEQRKRLVQNALA